MDAPGQRPWWRLHAATWMALALIIVSAACLNVDVYGVYRWMDFGAPKKPSDVFVGWPRHFDDDAARPPGYNVRQGLINVVALLGILAGAAAKLEQWCRRYRITVPLTLRSLNILLTIVIITVVIVDDHVRALALWPASTVLYVAFFLSCITATDLLGLAYRRLTARSLVRILLAIVYPLLSLSAFVLLYFAVSISEATVENRTDQDFVVTSVGDSKGFHSLLPVFCWRFPSFAASRCAGFSLPARASIHILHFRGERGLSGIDLLDSRSRLYSVSAKAPVGDRFVVDDLDSLNWTPWRVPPGARSSRAHDYSGWVIVGALSAPWLVWAALSWMSDKWVSKWETLQPIAAGLRVPPES